jgi:uncharacterized protein (DUF2236 family)
MLDAAALEKRLAEVGALAAGERDGVFGPRSVTWRVDREAALFLGAGRALLLQLAHPWVAAAITQHSTTLADPIGRFHRTFDVMFSLVFGTREEAFAAARRLHRRHASISGHLPHSAGSYAKGSPFLANEAQALLWVHASLIDTALAARECVQPPLSREDRERYYAESRLLAAMYGIPDDLVPSDWAAFETFMQTNCEGPTLAVTSEARAIAEALLTTGARRWMRPPRWYQAVTASLLPPRLREAFGLPFGEDEKRLSGLWLRRWRAMYPRLPERLRTVGPYQEACQRVSGRAGPDVLTRLNTKLWIGRGRLAHGG